MATASRSGSGKRKAKSRTGSRHVVNDVLGMASVLLQSRRDGAVEKIESVAQAVRDFGDELDGMAFAQDYIGEAAEALDDLAVYVAETEPARMLEDLEGIARRNPAVTLAFVVVSGVALTQIFRSWWPRYQAQERDGSPGERQRRTRGNG